jgi:hypothetical protein
LIEFNADPISDLEILEHFSGGHPIKHGMTLRHLKQDLLGFPFDRDHRPAQQAGTGGYGTGRQT